MREKCKRERGGDGALFDRVWGLRAHSERALHSKRDYIELKDEREM
jgi:hypothetical protein